MALGVLLILITMAVPSFTGSLQSTKADTEIGDLRRALNCPDGGDRPWYHHANSSHDPRRCLERRTHGV